MATATGTATSKARIKLDSRDVSRIFIVIVGAAILSAALATPWWTRGLTEDFDEDDNPRGLGEMQEGFYVQYKPYATPGSAAGFSTDAGRETATAVLGIALTLTGLFAMASGAVRAGTRLGWIETNNDTAVRFAIGAFVCGLFAVLWGAFFLPLLGPNPGWLYGDESDLSPEEEFGTDGEDVPVESTRYANVGFFLGIVGAVAFPAFLWADAARVRSESIWGTTTGTSANRPASAGF